MNIMCIVCGMMSGELWSGKNLEGSVCGLIMVLPHHFSKGTEENMNVSVSKAGVPLRLKSCIFYQSLELGTTGNVINRTGLILNTCLDHHQYPRQN